MTRCHLHKQSLDKRAINHAFWDGFTIVNFAFILPPLLKALANEDTLLRTHCCRHKCFPVCPRVQHLLRTQILWFCPETFCFRNKCFPVCAAQETSWATMCPQQCVLVYQGLNATNYTCVYHGKVRKAGHIEKPIYHGKLSSTMVKKAQLWPQPIFSPHNSNLCLESQETRFCGIFLKPFKKLAARVLSE